jgi:hypothetical protein
MTQEGGGKVEPPADQRPAAGLDKMGEPIIDPAPDTPPEWEDSPTGKAVLKGAKWGMVVGFGVAQLVIWSKSIPTPVGSIYGGNMFGVFALWIGLGVAIGAGIGWLSTKDLGEDDDTRPPPDLFG